MAKDAILNIIFGANTKELDKALDGATKRLRDTAGRMNDLGKTLSIGLTAPIAAFGAVATKNAVDSAKAIAQVEAAVKSTGGAAGKSVSELEAMADGLQRVSLFDDDEILKNVTANMLTFTNITGKEFDRAQQATLDLSTRLGTDLTSATVQVGKALNDPIKGVTALGRAGVQFTAQQKEQITAMQEAGDIAGAQNIILGELEKQFGGAAKAAADVDPYTQLSKEIGNLSEDFGKIINEFLKPLLVVVRRNVDAIKGWSDETKKTVLIVGGLLAVLGPTLLAVSSLINAYTTIKGALLAAKTAQLGLNTSILANPYVAAAAAVGVLIGAMVLYKSETDKARQAKEDFDRTIAGKQGREALQLIDQELATANAQWRENYRLVQANAQAVATWAAAGKEVPQDVQRSADSLNALDKQLRDNIASLTRQRQTAIQQQLQGQKDAETLRRLTEKQDENTESIDTNVTARETAYEVFKRTTAAYMAEQQALEDLNEEMANTALTLADLGEGPSVAEAILGKTPAGESPMNLMDLEMPEEFIPEEAIEGAERMVDAYNRAREAAQSFGTAVEQAIEQAAESMTINFSKMLGQTLATGKGMEGLGRMVLNTLADLAVQVGEIAIGVGITIKGIRKSLESLNPAVALIAGIALVALGTYAKTALQSAGGGSVPAFAQGGLTTGPMLAMVGDNQSGKEAIIPFERMGEFLQMAGAGQSNANVTVTGRLQGRDLVISNERTTFNRNRTKY